MEYLPCVKRLIGLSVLSLSATTYAHDLHYFVVENIAAPLQIIDEENTHSGIVTDIVIEIARLAELDLKITVAPSPRIELLLKEESDVNWIAYDSPSWDSLPNGIAFEPAVTQVHHSVLHCGTFRDFEELEAYEIAIIKDFRYPGLNKHASEFSLELTEVKSYEQGLELVDLERVDGFIEMDLRLSYHVSQHPDQKCTKLTYIDDIEPPYAIELKVNQNMPQSRVKKLKHAYQTLHESGFIQETIEKYTR